METLRVLYVEDNPFDRDLVLDVLLKEHNGFSLVLAGSREELAAELGRGRFDLVLSDFNILGFEGFSVIEAVHAMDPSVPVVIVTGTGSEEIAVQAMKRGAADYVIKTLAHIRRLPATIRSVVEKQRLEEDRRRDEHRIAELNENIRRMVADAEDPILVLDEKDAVQFANDAAIKLFGERIDLTGFGFPRAPMLGQEICVPQPEGTPVIVEMHLKESSWYGEPARVLSLRDVTERKKARDDLAQLNSILSALSQLNQLIVQEKDPK